MNGHTNRPHIHPKSLIKLLRQHETSQLSCSLKTGASKDSLRFIEVDLLVAREAESFDVDLRVYACLVSLHRAEGNAEESPAKVGVPHYKSKNCYSWQEQNAVGDVKMAASRN